MAVNDYIDIKLSDIPCQFDYTFDDTDYTLDLYYNKLNDSYYINLYDENMVPIVMGEKLVYGQPLWNAITDPRLPLVNLVPFDEDNNETEVSKLNFTDSIQLYIKNVDEVPDDIPTDNTNDDNDVDDSVSENPSDVDFNEYGNDKQVGGDNTWN